MKNPDLSLVIICYNESAVLKRCLTSLKNNVTAFAPEIIVVDNASTDDSVRMVKAHFPDVTVVENRENLGYGGAVNSGLKQAHGEFFAFMNSDTEVTYDLFTPMMDYLRQHAGAGAAGCRLIFPGGAEQRSYYRFPTLTGRILYYTGINALLNAETAKRLKGEHDKSDVMDVEIVCGAFMMLRREVMQALNGFDRDYFLYHDEADLCFRLRKRGLRSVIMNRHTLVHHGDHRESADNEKVFYHRNRSLLIYFYKNCSRLSLLALLMIDFFFLSGRFILHLIPAGDSRLRAKRRKNYAAALKYHLSFIPCVFARKRTEFPP